MIKKLFYIALAALLFGALISGWPARVKARLEGPVAVGPGPGYPPSAVRRMMAYHGALVSRYEGGRWLFLKGRRWIPLEAGGAQAVASLPEAGSRAL